MRIENKQVLGGYTRTSKSAPAPLTATPTAPIPTPSEAAEVRALMVAASLAAMLTGPLAVTPVSALVI